MAAARSMRPMRVSGSPCGRWIGCCPIWSRAFLSFLNMPRKAGTPKTGGRKPGSLNKRTAAIKARLLADEELSVESTVEAIRRGSQYDVRALFHPDGRLKQPHELTEAEAWPIVQYDVLRGNVDDGDGKSDTIVRVKFEGRRGYVELGARYQGMLTDKVEISGDDALIAALMMGRKRAAEQSKSPAK